MKMITQQTLEGFTIIEVLIVIAIVGFLFAAAIVYLAGDTTNAEFTTSINDSKQEMEQIVNETASGFYSDNNKFTCKANPPSYPILGGPPANSPQGGNYGCIFLGKILQFAVNTSNFSVYPVVGNEMDSAGNYSTSIDDSSPEIIPSDSVTQPFEYGLKVTSMNAVDEASGSSVATTAVAFLAGDAGGNLNGGAASSLSSNSEQMTLYYDSGLDVSLQNDVQNQLLKVASEVTICLAGGNNKSGLIKIGGDGSLAVSLTIWPGSTCT